MKNRPSPQPSTPPKPKKAPSTPKISPSSKKETSAISPEKKRALQEKQRKAMERAREKAAARLKEYQKDYNKVDVALKKAITKFNTVKDKAALKALYKKYGKKLIEDHRLAVMSYRQEANYKKSAKDMTTYLAAVMKKNNGKVPASERRWLVPLYGYARVNYHTQLARQKIASDWQKNGDPMLQQDREDARKFRRSLIGTPLRLAYKVGSIDVVNRQAKEVYKLLKASPETMMLLKSLKMDLGEAIKGFYTGVNEGMVVIGGEIGETAARIYLDPKAVAHHVSNRLISFASGATGVVFDPRKRDRFFRGVASFAKKKVKVIKESSTKDIARKFGRAYASWITYMGVARAGKLLKGPSKKGAKAPDVQKQPQGAKAKHQEIFQKRIARITKATAVAHATILNTFKSGKLLSPELYSDKKIRIVVAAIAGAYIKRISNPRERRAVEAQINKMADTFISLGLKQRKVYVEAFARTFLLGKPRIQDSQLLLSLYQSTTNNLTISEKALLAKHLLKKIA